MIMVLWPEETRMIDLSTSQYRSPQGLLGARGTLRARCRISIARHRAARVCCISEVTHLIPIRGLSNSSEDRRQLRPAFMNLVLQRSINTNLRLSEGTTMQSMGRNLIPALVLNTRLRSRLSQVSLLCGSQWMMQDRCRIREAHRRLIFSRRNVYECLQTSSRQMDNILHRSSRDQRWTSGTSLTKRCKA